jgi:hypothetical protein
VQFSIDEREEIIRGNNNENYLWSAGYKKEIKINCAKKDLNAQDLSALLGAIQIILDTLLTLL